MDPKRNRFLYDLSQMDDLDWHKYQPKASADVRLLEENLKILTVKII